MRDAFNDIDTGIVDAALERADISAVNIGKMCEFFLREPLLEAQIFQITRKNFPYLHWIAENGLDEYLTTEYTLHDYP